jgi:parallel beta-helix repeat protein
MEADMRVFTFSLLLVILAVPALEAANCGGAIPCKCGDTVTSNYVMPADLGPCSGHGLSLASGVTLDGNGRRISGPANGSDFYGVYLRGMTGGTVKNVVVTGFRHGIRLRDAHGNQILDSKAFRNGDFSAHVGYGIDVAISSSNNTFRNNLVYDNADEGVHLGSGTGDNTFVGNSVYNNFHENIYLLDSHNNTLTDTPPGAGKTVCMSRILAST